VFRPRSAVGVVVIGLIRERREAGISPSALRQES